jgi:hypothetical protein
MLAMRSVTDAANWTEENFELVPEEPPGDEPPGDEPPGEEPPGEAAERFNGTPRC